MATSKRRSGRPRVAGKQLQIVALLPAKMVAQVDALRRTISEDGPVSRAAVLRRLVKRGLASYARRGR